MPVSVVTAASAQTMFGVTQFLMLTVLEIVFFPIMAMLQVIALLAVTMLYVFQRFVTGITRLCVRTLALPAARLGSLSWLSCRSAVRLGHRLVVGLAVVVEDFPR